MNTRNLPRDLLLCGALCWATIGVTRGAAPAAPKPGPEHEKLAYFVGKWTSAGELKPGPFGPGGKLTTKDDCQWFAGKFAVVCRGTGTSPAGPTQSLGILSYSDEEKAYTYYGIDNSPMTQTTVPRGTIDGDTWTYSDESKMGGKLTKSRYTVKIVSPASYTYLWELQDEKGAWITLLSGTDTRVGAKVAAKP